MRGAFVFDPNRCTGCSACELACSIENQLGTDRSWRSVLSFNERGIPGVPVFHLSLACNHCETAACMEACPALAYERDPATGAVLIRQDACIGCRYCSWACPYGAPRFESDRGVMGKCTFCSHRLADGRKPACAALCPTGALDYETLDEDQLLAQIDGMPRTQLGPSIRILPLERRSTAGLTNAVTTGSGAGVPLDVTPHEPRIELAGEWSLAVFTLLLAVLFGLLAADTVGTRAVSPLLFATISALAAGLSLAHLGRPARAWRAVLGIRRSPVSREVLGFGLMASLGMLALSASEATVSAAAAWPGLAAGLVALVSADRVYGPVHHDGSPVLHSAGVLLTGLYLAGLMAGSAGMALLIGGGKLVRYVRRTRQAGVSGPGAAIRRLAVASRVGLGFVVPAAAWVIGGTPLTFWALVAAVLGEAIDRAEFYSELEIISPARQQRLDLDARLAELPSSPPAPALIQS
ncbi:MAG: 4Fe-4S dicluster domain-containing protein [marine benthic group bacterium]|nr:4Fe-4S dicluster domain-containing protein [Gemmatimonadota bacterium]